MSFGLMSFGLLPFGLMSFGLMSFGLMLFGILSVGILLVYRRWSKSRCLERQIKGQIALYTAGNTDRQNATENDTIQ